MNEGLEDPVAEHDPLLGTLIGGRYRLRGVLGRGGMGVVYDAVHEELGRPVAIKVVSNTHAKDPTVIDRFMREARVVAQIGHPNIVAVHDLGRLDDERPYLVMERLYGASFYELLTTHGRMDAARVAELLDGAASALEVVHGKGIIHRDIKLENLMIARSDDNSEVVKLLDFGIAAIAVFSPDAKRITAQGMITGTPLYIAPEAATGDRPDHRADIYSLAVVAYSLLTGFAPFDSDNPVVILSKKLAQEPPKLSVGGDSFSEALEMVIAKGLARMPEERYASAKAFVRDLKAAAIGVTPVTTPPPALRTPPRLKLENVPPSQSAFETTIVREQREPREPRMPRNMLDGQGERPLLGDSWSVRAADERTAPEESPFTTEQLIAQGKTPAGERIAKLAPIIAGAIVLIGVLAYLQTKPTTEALPVETVPVETVKVPVAAPPPVEVKAATTAAPAIARVEEPPPPPVKKKGPAKHVPAPPPVKTAPEALEAPPKKPEEPRGPDVSVPGIDRARAEAMTRAGMKALVEGLLPKAIENFREATNAAPRHAPAWRGLGLANDKMGRKAEALKAFRQYLVLSTGEDPGVVSGIRERVKALEESR